MKGQTYFISLLLIGVLSLTTSCQNDLSIEEIQAQIDNGDISQIQQLKKQITNNTTIDWKDLHNLGYLNYLSWKESMIDTILLEQSYQYFLDSYELGEDPRTEQDIELIETLLERLQDKEIGEEEENTTEDTDTQEDQTLGGNEEEEGDEDRDSRNNTRESSDGTGTPSPAIFEDLGYGSEEELLRELERYTKQLQETESQYRPYIGQELQENTLPFGDMFGDTFGIPGGLFGDIPTQSEKDW